MVESRMEHEQRPAAIVTGAGSGIGRETAGALHERGWRLVLVGRRPEALEETGRSLGGEGRAWIAVPADIGVGGERERVLETALGRFGRIDAIINNAALGTCKALDELREEEIDRLFAVNAIGPIGLVRGALPELIERRGCVVNVASMSMIDPFPGLGVYGCTKAAIDALTRCVHNEYGERGVRAYTIAPGAVETGMLRAIVSKGELPSEQTLAPERVAGRIVACVMGECEEASGSTIVMRSP